MSSFTKTITENLTTPIVGEYDVIVAGGGTAGVAAAVASGREGAKTLLIESAGFVGGSLLESAGPMHSFFNGYRAFPDAPKTQVVHGIPQEIIERLMTRGGSCGHLEQIEGGNVDSTATLVERETAKFVFLEMLEEAGVEVLLYTNVVSTLMEGSAIQGVIVENKSGRQAVLAKVVIDCTGDADVAARAGAEYQDESVSGAVSMIFGMANVDVPRLEQFAVEQGILYHGAHAERNGVPDSAVRISFDCSKLPAFAGLMREPFELKNDSGNMEDRATLYGPMCVAFREGELNMINSTIVVGVHALDAWERSKANMTLRHLVWTMAETLRKNVPGFEKAHINWTPNTIGIRRTRIVKCEYDLSLDEVVNGARFAEEIDLFGYMDMAPKILINDGKWYGIPYRCLVPQKIENLLVAGRLISSDFRAHMSTRNTPCCMEQGQAAGTAAAIATRLGVTVRDLNVNTLRARLIENGVFLNDTANAG